MAIDSLIELVYAELRALAGRYLRRERTSHTLEPTALVHEAFLRLAHAPALGVVDQTHFMAIAASVMRRILVEHARGRATGKRGGQARRLTLDSSIALENTAPILDLLALDQAIEKLARRDARQARVVELRYFGGMSVAEVAKLLEVSTRSIELDWTLARAFLRRELEE